MEYYTDREFYIDKGLRGLVLCTRAKELVLMMFEKPGCPYCTGAKPILARLAEHWAGTLRVRSVNLHTYPSLIDMSQQTIAPLTMVPTIILYTNGRPYVMYDGDITEPGLFEFCRSMVAQIRARQTSHNGSRDRDEWGQAGGGSVHGDRERERERDRGGHPGGGGGQGGGAHDPLGTESASRDPQEAAGMGVPYNSVLCDKNRCYLVMDGGQ
jgi:thiol-disulfide isomerase/thioredoxin